MTVSRSSTQEADEVISSDEQLITSHSHAVQNKHNSSKLAMLFPIFHNCVIAMWNTFSLLNALKFVCNYVCANEYSLFSLEIVLDPSEASHACDYKHNSSMPTSCFNMLSCMEPNHGERLGLHG